VRRGAHSIAGEALAASGPLQPAALLMAALRTSEPYFSLQGIRFRQARGHGPAAAMGAFYQQSVRLNQGRHSNIVPLDQQRSAISDGSCSIRTSFSAVDSAVTFGS
jgi:hypothetical protein